MNQEAKKKAGRKGNLYKTLNLSTVSLKLARHPLVQNKLTFILVITSDTLLLLLSVIISRL
jgi:hypothetical protein